jgi:hypothetical protein
MVSITLRQFCPRKTPSDICWVGPNAGLDAVRKRKSFSFAGNLTPDDANLQAFHFLLFSTLFMKLYETVTILAYIWEKSVPLLIWSSDILPAVLLGLPQFIQANSGIR